jgi:hypothetical protein
MTQDFKLTMDITPRGTVGHWGSIIHFTTGRDCCDFGHRAPGIWFAPNTIDTFALHIGYANDGGWAARPSGMPFQIGKTTRLELLCRGEKITITVDNKVYNYTHDSYRYSGPVTVYGGNPWYPPANCTIMNVCLETYGNPIQPFTCPTTLLPKSYVPRANTILANNITMTQDFILQFDITPKAIVGNWGSIMHFTTGGDCCGFGQRAPGIWFWPGTLELLFVVSDSQHGNFYPTGKFEGCSMNKKSRVVMVCKGKEVTITVDDNVKKFTQPTHRYSGPLTVFGSNPWYPAANCAVENVCLQLLGNSTKVPFRINIGNSNTNEKVVPLPPGLPSTFRLVKHIPQGYSDDYVYRFQGNNLIVRRVDHFGGWGAQTVAEISEGVQPHMSNIAFVRIEGGSMLNMSQLVVLDEYGDNISRGRPQQVNSETYGDANRTKANDGGEAPRPHPQEYHGRGADDLWQVQLAGLKKVSAVIVYNRSDCCQDRMASGFVIKLYAPRPTGGYMTVFVSNKLTAAPVQVIRTFDNNTGEKTVHGNNGTVTCEQYCHGPSSLGWGTGPWNGELPQSWNGAKCVGYAPDIGGCYTTFSRSGAGCVCEPTGTGWK